MNLRFVSCASLPILLLILMSSNSADAQSFSSKKVNPFKNPFTAEGEYVTPAFRGWNFGFNYTGFAVRQGYVWFDGADDKNFLIQKVMYTPEVHFGYRTGNRLFVGADMMFGIANYETTEEITELNQSLSMNYNSFYSGYLGSIGFALEPYKEHQRQKSAIVLSGFVRFFQDRPDVYLSDSQTGDILKNDIGDDDSSLGFQLMYERSVLNRLHLRGGFTYTVKGDFDYYNDAKAKLGFTFGTLVQF